ncbi:MAG TPA: Rieske 2Fe-2S domain-containing protein [Alphaproteobacteria bacterium]|nr:Rieske 2Fe-2S domain-containing protein [Alphaproteobacteria bacterium]
MDDQRMEIPDDENEIRTIEAKPPSHRYARGWYCLGVAKDFKDGRPHTLNAFGTKLVVFQGESGKLNVLNAYCPHMGGDLSEGEVKGESIACPFHDWRWGGDGKCTLIPYAKYVPPRARTRAWPTMERNQQLLVWNDPENGEPDYDIIPDLADKFAHGWSALTWKSEVMETNVRELIDNMSDLAHFFYVHGEGKRLGPSYFKNIFEGQIGYQYMEFHEKGSTLRHDPGVPFTGTVDDIAPGNFRSEGVYYGPAYMLNPHWRNGPEGQMESILFNAHYPITPDSFMLHVGVIVKDDPRLSPEQNAARAAMISGYQQGAFYQDVHIWKTKTRVDNPLLCHADGPIYQLRRWHDQFYCDTAEIDPLMTRRFEWTADLSYANEVWDRQIVENLEREALRSRV